MSPMTSPVKFVVAVAALALLSIGAPGMAWATDQTRPLPSSAAIDAEVKRVMGVTGSKGLALAVIDDGQPTFVQAWGDRIRPAFPTSASLSRTGS